MGEPASGDTTPREEVTAQTGSPPALKGESVFIALFVSFIALLLYRRTLFPSVLAGDSAEFQVLATQFGLCHAPGHAVYISLVHLFSLLEFGPPAYRANMFSAVMGAATVGEVYLAAHVLTANRLASLTAALGLCVSFTFWTQSVIAEVYTAESAAVAAVWLCLLLWYRTGSRAALFAAGFAGAAGLGVHTSLALLAPSALLFIREGRNHRDRHWLPSVGGSILGLLLSFCLFVVADLHAPPANAFNTIYAPASSLWHLQPAELDRFPRRLVFMWTAEPWRFAMFHWDLLPHRLLGYLAMLPRELGLATVLIVAAGFVTLFERERAVWRLCVTALLPVLVFNGTYNVGDIDVFYLPTYVVLAVVAAYGAAAVCHEARRSLPLSAPVTAAVPLVVLTAVVFPMIRPYWTAIEARRFPFIHVQGAMLNGAERLDIDQLTSIVKDLPRDAIVFTDWHRLYTYYYIAHTVEQRRDLRFVEAQPYGSDRTLPVSTFRFISDHIGAHPILFTDAPYLSEEHGYCVTVQVAGGTGLFRISRTGCT